MNTVVAHNNESSESDSRNREPQSYRYDSVLGRKHLAIGMDPFAKPSRERNLRIELARYRIDPVGAELFISRRN
jgi:hypothetical protein